MRVPLKTLFYIRTNMAKDFAKREQDYSKWYNELVVRADLAETSDVRGAMIIKPYGYAIWEKMQAELDRKFKQTGHQNAYFPLFIPKSYFSKEADHVDGFAKECAVVTHYRLKNSEDGKGVEVDPDAKLEEELVVRPTSETIIWNSFKKWIRSYRDLPLKINQWANVVRWEMRTRLFLRTSEFLWQEGHTAHATKEEAVEEAELMLNVYADFVENFMAIPVLKGVKTESERFAGALETYCIEALMQDGKALQAGTSHFLGQNFARAFDVKYAAKSGQEAHVWATSWGVSTRLIGALIMTHSDDNGLVLPPKLAPIHVAIVPIYRNEEQLEAISEKANALKSQLEAKGLIVKYDDRDTHKPGWKFSEYEFKGVPLRIAIGPKDLEKGTVELARRDTLIKEFVNYDDVAQKIFALLDEIQHSLYQRALNLRNDRTKTVDNWDDFKAAIKAGGFVKAYWDGTPETENKIKELTKATIRLMPLPSEGEGAEGECVLTKTKTNKLVYFARAY